MEKALVFHVGFLGVYWVGLTGLYLIETPYTLFLFALIGYFLIICLHASLYGLLDVRALFLVTSGAYIFAGQLDLFLFGDILDLQEDAAKVGLYSCLCTMCVFATMSAISPRVGVARRFVMDHSFNWKPIEYLLVGIIVFYFIAVGISFGFEVGKMDRGELYQTDMTGVSVFRLVIFGMFIAYFSDYVSCLNRRNDAWLIFFVLAIFIAIELFMFGDRRLTISLALCMAYMFFNRRLKWFHYIFGGAFMFALLIYGPFRNSPISNWASIMSNISIADIITPGGTEFAPFSLIFDDLYRSGFSYPGMPYLDAIIQLIPKLIMPDRPLTPAVWFVENFYPAIAVVGGGLAFNAVAESIIAFSFVGPLVLGFATGFLVICAAFLDRKNNTPYWLGFLSFILSFLMRFDFASLLKLVVISGFGSGLYFFYRSVLVSRYNRQLI